jgi:hypothetical protein
MKKATFIVSGICALTCINNTFGMLTQKNMIRKITYKKTQQIHTSKPVNNILGSIYCPCLPQDCRCGRKKPTNEKLVEENNELLLKELIRKRNQFKTRNKVLSKYITKQNTIIKELNNLDDSPTIVKFLGGEKITCLAQQLLELEQKIEQEIRK